jgi:hypothetical protein
MNQSPTSIAYPVTITSVPIPPPIKCDVIRRCIEDLSTFDRASKHGVKRIVINVTTHDLKGFVIKHESQIPSEFIETFVPWSQRQKE